MIDTSHRSRTWRTPSRKKSKKSSPWHTMFKLWKIKDKKNLETHTEEQHLTYVGRSIRFVGDFLS